MPMWPQRPDVANDRLKAISTEQNGDLTPASRFPTLPQCLPHRLSTPARRGAQGTDVLLAQHLPASSPSHADTWSPPSLFAHRLKVIPPCLRFFLAMLTPYLHLPSVLGRLETWREGAQDWEKEPEWPLIRAGSSQHAGRGLNDGLNVLELWEHADKGEEGAGRVRGGEGRVGKVRPQTISSSSHGLGWTEPPSKSASSSSEHLLCARRFVNTTS